MNWVQSLIECTNKWFVELESVHRASREKWNGTPHSPQFKDLHS